MKVILLNIWPWKTKKVFPGFLVWFTSGKDFQTSVLISIVLWGPVGNRIKIQFLRVSPGDPTADQPLTDRGAGGHSGLEIASCTEDWPGGDRKTLGTKLAFGWAWSTKNDARTKHFTNWSRKSISNLKRRAKHLAHESSNFFLFENATLHTTRRFPSKVIGYQATNPFNSETDS